MGRRFENNYAEIAGVLSNPLKYDHEINGEKFYSSAVSVKRLSGVSDVIPIMISERLVGEKKMEEMSAVMVSGSFRSHNIKTESGKKKKKIHVFVDEIILPNETGDVKWGNEIHLEGYVCNDVSFRKTTTFRKVAEFLLCVHRPYGRRDYIPCLCWNRNALFARDTFIPGTKVSLNGRIQSRGYSKKIGGSTELLVAYEVSASDVEIIIEEKEENGTEL